MITATIALALHIQSAQTYDVRLPAVIGDVMAVRLSEVFGETIRVDSSFADVPMVFYAEGVTFERFRELSASGLGASWRESGPGWELYRTREQARAVEARFSGRRASGTRKAFAELRPDGGRISDELLAELSGSLKLGLFEEAQRAYFTSDEIPGEWILYDCWQALGADYIVSLPIDTRVVFTSDGYGGTKKLDALTKLVQELRVEYARIEAELKKTGALYVVETSAADFTIQDLYSIVGAAPFHRLVLEVVAHATELEIVISGYDESGRLLDNNYDWLEALDDEDRTLPESIASGEVQLSEESLELAKSLSGLEDLNKFIATIVDMLAAMPDKDPYSYDATDVLFAAARAAGKSLVAELSDDVLFDGPLFGFGNDDVRTTGKIPLAAGLEWLHDSMDIEVTADGLLRVRPTLPTRFQTHVPRKAIGEYVRRNRGKAPIDLGRVPSLVAEDRPLESEPLGHIAFLAHGSASALAEPSIEVLTAWQTLPPLIKQASLSSQGANVKLGSLHGSFRRDFLGKAIEGRWSQLRSEDGFESDTGDTIADVMLFDVSTKTFDDLDINVRAIRKPTVYVSMKDAELIAMTPEDLAGLIYAQERRGERGQNLLKGLNISLKDAQTVELRFSTPAGTGMMQATVIVSDQSQDRLAIEQLPRDFLAAYERELARLKGDGQRRQRP